MVKTKISTEYTFKTSAPILFNCINSPSGLAEWFADDVNIKGNVFTFIWDGSEESAELIGKKQNEYVKFHWEDDDDDDSFFELRIRIDALTKEVALVVTDFAEEDEEEESIMWWDSQVLKLRQRLGS